MVRHGEKINIPFCKTSVLLHLEKSYLCMLPACKIEHLRVSYSEQEGGGGEVLAGPHSVVLGKLLRGGGGWKPQQAFLE